MTAIVHAHTPESRHRLRMLCGLPYREIGKNGHSWPKEWGQHDVTCPECLALVNGKASATIGAEFVDANGCEVSP